MIKKKCIYWIAICFLISACSKGTIKDEIITGLKVCYKKRVDNQYWQIFLAGVHGFTSEISNNPGRDCSNPTPSPDGRWIAYRYDRPVGGCDIYLYDCKRNSTINFTIDLPQEESAYPVLWSPNSDKLVYRYFKSNNIPEYHIINKDGSGRKKLLSTDSARIISFDNFGETLIILQNNILKRLDISTVALESILDLSTVGDYPTYVHDYNPIENKILCTENLASWEVGLPFLLKEIDLNSFQIDTLRLAKDSLRILFPIYSKDYQKIAYFQSDRFTSEDKLIVLEGNDHKVAHNLTAPRLCYSPDRMEFSSDNNYLLFVILEFVTTSGRTVYFEKTIHVVNLSNGKSFFIDEGSEPHWCN